MSPLCKLPWGRLAWMASMVLGGPSSFRKSRRNVSRFAPPVPLFTMATNVQWPWVQGRRWVTVPPSAVSWWESLQICHHPCSVHWGCHHHPGHLHGPSALICTWEQTISSWQTSLYGFRSHKHWSRQICPGGQWGLWQMMISRTGTIKSIYHFVKERCLSGHSNFLPMPH